MGNNSSTPPDPSLPVRESAPVVVNSPTQINNSDLNNITFAPVTTFDLDPQIYNNLITNIDLVDEEFNSFKLKIINHLLAGVVSGSAVFNESPLYYGSLGLITSGSKIYARPYFGEYNTAAAIAGGAFVSSLMGKDPIASGIILSIGSLAESILK